VTVDPKFAIHRTLAIKDGHFAAVGTEREARLWTGPGTRVVNLGGRTVIPGLIDSHIHASVAGSTWDFELHWEFTRSLADGLKQIASTAKSQPAGEPTGVLQGVPAWEYAYNKLPAPSFDGMQQSFRDCFRELNRLGVTSVDDLHTSGITFAQRRLLAEMARSGQLTLRLNYYVAP